MNESEKYYAELAKENPLLAKRLEKIYKMKAQGIDPFGAGDYTQFADCGSILEVKKNAFGYENLTKEEQQRYNILYGNK